MSVLKKLFHLMPDGAQTAIRNVVQNLPWTRSGRHNRWVRHTYFKFGQDQRKLIFLSAARFLHINRPISGYYFEFGCNEANTMRMAYDNFRFLFDFTYVGFDSFEGLPEIAKIDEQENWKKGKLAFAEERFREICLDHGIPENRLRTIRGFYDKSLTSGLADELASKKAAVIYIDCDLYLSTVPILAWIPPFLQVGTIIVFDDWNCFCADPERGERRAWREFLEGNSHLRFVPFVSTAEGQAFICVSTGTPTSIEGQVG
jgi:hypothetical protein